MSSWKKNVIWLNTSPFHSSLYTQIHTYCNNHQWPLSWLSVMDCPVFPFLETDNVTQRLNCFCSSHQGNNYRGLIFYQSKLYNLSYVIYIVNLQSQLLNVLETRMFKSIPLVILWKMSLKKTKNKNVVITCSVKHEVFMSVIVSLTANY